ncbi:uncharacterized protein LOC110458917 isoform X2 [Mizuhopecten yessoensis]|uniref:Migration and invasion-inhibitory protein n=1 Tax=Mizuhopecten yessoensis TaxID=6573 RepID=A0A210Q5R5_MIZYE|nr:uncharacterized protein LOC110458917 isoform X2 [Mizuhopecten yessoensis]OWF44084.1 Migration and invasion-inhibitory protein [Mizuhopecten yessoensis]
MDIDEQLRAQSKVLLQRLKARQGKLQNIVHCQSNEDTISKENNSEKIVKSIIPQKSSAHKCSSNEAELDVSTTAVKRPNSGQPRARQQLAKARQNSRKKSDGDKPQKVSQGVLTGSNNFNTHNQKLDVGDKDIHEEGENSVTTPKVIDDEDRLCGQLSNLRSDVVRSRNTERDTDAKERRKIIDKNVKVDSQLNESELCREDDKSRLNFSYSKFDESDINYLRSKFGSRPEDIDIDKVEDKATEENNNAADHNTMLQSAGNDRKTANFIRDTMSKPKSILFSSGPKDLKKSLSKVSFLSSRDGSMSVPDMDRHLLGYDWIAALLDNDRGAMDHSESYFEELREFRRINRDECINNFYMDGVDELLANRDREASPVAEALEVTKVKPYTVNDRLFTEPLKQQVFDYSTNDDKEHKKTKPPTFEEPRFVRVSIPRSTLLSPHRVKPHRRKSIDDTDSFSLSTHCVKGYENAVPSMVPAASNVGLRDATYGTRSAIQTTLADAEKVAASFPYPWTSSATDRIRQPHSDHTDLYKSYQDMTLPSRLQTSTGGTGEESVALKQATEDLLNSTYSLMFEMEKIKKQRDGHSTRQIGNVAY